MARWIAGKGFGFIAPAGSGEDLFCHRSSCWVQLRQLDRGVRVSFDEFFDERKGRMRAINVSLVERGWGDIQPVPLVWNLDQQAKAAQGHPGREPEREPLPEREPWGPRGEQKARYRTFSVDICKAKSVPLGLQVSTMDGFGLEVI